MRINRSNPDQPAMQQPQAQPQAAPAAPKPAPKRELTMASLPGQCAAVAAN